jgi:hypothetical protein
MSKPEAETHLTDEEILSAPTASLSLADLQRRIVINQMRQAEVALEKTEVEAQKYREEKSERARKAAAGRQIVQDENERIQMERNYCKHLTGGKGLAGLLQGDGKQGYSIATQELPTGEIYHICFRCQREWHLPKKRDVLNGTSTLRQYREQEKEYHRISSVDKQLFATDTGGVPGSCKFRIPKLEAQRLLDDQEFAVYLESHPGLDAHAG